MIFTLLVALLSFNYVVNGWSTSVFEVCTTRLRRDKATTKTLTHTRYVEYVSTSTSTLRDTIAFSTLTSTYYETSYNDIYPTTVLEYTTVYEPVESIVYLTSTSSETMKYTITQGLTTITVPTPSGFTPAASIFSDTALIKDNVATGLRATVSNTHIICHEKVILYTSVTTTIRASTAITTTETSQVENVETVVTETITSSETVPYTSLSFVLASSTWYTTTIFVENYYTTSTSTTTTIPTATAYAACATNNVISAIGPNDADRIVEYGSSMNPLVLDNIPDPYSCCARCFEAQNCTGMSYGQFSLESEEECYLFFVEIDDHCNVSAPAGWGFYTGPDFPGEGVWYIANGPCGQGVYEGPV